ncbi:hypothetical protein P9209_16320 [Prescottella defluvii]|nr:hypothetical protein P9209_16320 [Prescottella defluvii]
MTKSLISHVTRRRAAVAVAGIAAAGALAVPGVAWAQNAIPGGEPTAVGSPAVVSTPAAAEVSSATEIAPAVTDPGSSASVKRPSGEESQKASPMVEPMVTFAPSGDAPVR